MLQFIFHFDGPPHLQGTRWRSLCWIATAYSHCDLQNSFSSSHLQHLIRAPPKRGRYLETLPEAQQISRDLKDFPGPEGDLKGRGKSRRHSLLINPSLGTYQEIPSSRPISIAYPGNDERMMIMTMALAIKRVKLWKGNFMSDALARF